MFFRLSKNSIKNAVFDPFGGGYPPSPLNSLYIAPAYDFIRKSSFFNKNLLFLFYLFPLGGEGLPKAVTPLTCQRGSTSTRSSGGHELGYVSVWEEIVLNFFSCGFYFVEMITTHPPECTDEERTTCSGGTDTWGCATARLAQGHAGRQVAQTHHENLNLTLFNFYYFHNIFYRYHAPPTIS